MSAGLSRLSSIIGTARPSRLNCHTAAWASPSSVASMSTFSVLAVFSTTPGRNWLPPGGEKLHGPRDLVGPAGQVGGDRRDHRRPRIDAVGDPVSPRSTGDADGRSSFRGAPV